MSWLMRSQIISTGGRNGGEDLDRPANNYDVAGIPREQWSTGLLDCAEDAPSCWLSIFCLPCLWSQVSRRECVRDRDGECV